METNEYSTISYLTTETERLDLSTFIIMKWQCTFAEVTH